MTSRLDDLEAMRELLWESVRAAPVDKKAPLFARLESVIEQIETLTPTESVGDPIDEIAARRAARGGATSRLGHAQGGKG